MIPPPPERMVSLSRGGIAEGVAARRGYVRKSLGG